MPINVFSGPYRFLSNFWPAKVHLDGAEYPSVENAYQAAKTINPEERKQFLTCGPPQARRSGRQVHLREDWSEVQLTIMYTLVFEKFSTHPELTQLLLDTGDEELVEGNNWRDTFWGSCQGRGQNHLGRIIMKVRSQLQIIKENKTNGRVSGT